MKLNLLVILLLCCSVSPLLAQPRPPQIPQKPGGPVVNDKIVPLPPGIDTVLRHAEMIMRDSLDPRAAAIVLAIKSSADSIVLRWGISKPGGWLTANGHGYIIERAESDDQWNIDTVKGYIRLTEKPIMPWTLDEWAAHGAENRIMLGVAAQALYGERFVPQGGSAVMNSLRNRADELSNRWSFSHLAADVDPVAAEGLGLRFVDRTVKRDGHYIYRVVMAMLDTAYIIRSGYMTAVAQKMPPVPPPAGFQWKDVDGRVLLGWDKISRDGATYSGFVIERALPGGEFTRLNEEPLVAFDNQDTAGVPQEFIGRAMFSDSIGLYQSCRYRVRGMTPFGELTDPSDEVKVMLRDMVPPPPPVLLAAQESGRNQITVNWKMEEFPDDFKGFIITRSSSYEGVYEPIHKGTLTREVNAFIDNDPLQDTTNYYIVQATDTSGNVSSSMAGYAFMVDSIPPGKPIGMKGTIDTNGIVRLTWTRGKERDLLGYRVYRTNSTEKGYEYIQITSTPVSTVSFVDTIVVRTLTREVFYKIVAVDRNFNNSEFSEGLRLERPDLLPPVPPLLSSVIVTDTTVYLRWVPSSSRDVRSHIVYRRMNGETSWKQIGGILGRTADSFADRDVRKKETYEYSVAALDSTGHRSDYSFSALARPYDNGVRPGVMNLRATVDQSTRVVKLTWSYTKTTGTPRFILYRSTDSGGLSQFTAISGERREFEDKATGDDGTYQYAIRVVHDADGGESELSPVATADVGMVRMR